VILSSSSKDKILDREIGEEEEKVEERKNKSHKSSQIIIVGVCISFNFILEKK
jgi:hypothetical protein